MRHQRGATAVEFAIVFPLLILLMFGIIEFSIILYDKAMITNASREGARAGIVSQLVRVSDSQIQSVVDNYCRLYLISFRSGAAPVTTVARTGSTFGSELSVTVTYTYSFLALPQFVTGLVGPMNLTARTVMRME
jgi:Flp pilus assembly protein TadG